MHVVGRMKRGVVQQAKAQEHVMRFYRARPR
jgi:hypothetical protein